MSSKRLHKTLPGSSEIVLCFLQIAAPELSHSGRSALMAPIDRRRFLQQSLAAGAGCSAELLLSRLLPAQTPAPVPGRRCESFWIRGARLLPLTAISLDLSWSIWAAPSTKASMTRAQNYPTRMDLE